MLVDSGLPAALQSLAETRDLQVTAPDLGRFDAAVETTVYQLLEIATVGTPAAVTLARHDNTLRLLLTVAGVLPNLASAADRIVTLSGQIAVPHDGGKTVMEVDLPVGRDEHRGSKTGH